MILMESYYYYLLSISFGYVFCLHMLCIKVYMKTNVGETHRDNKMRFDLENHKIQKAMDQKHARQSWTEMGSMVGYPVNPMG